MAKFYLQKHYIKGRFSLPIIVLTTIVIWLISHILQVYKDPEALINTSRWSFGDPTSLLFIWESQSIAFFAYAFIAYLLIILNNSFNIISQRATAQSATYLLLISCIPQIHFIYSGLVSTILILIASYFFFKTYKNSDASVLYFYAGLFWGISFLVLPKSILLFPLLLIAGIFFSSLSLRTFFASLLGIGLVVWIFFSICYLSDATEIFYLPFNDLSAWGNLEAYQKLDGNNLITFIFVLALALASITYLTLSQPKMKIKTYYILNYLFTLSIGSIIIIIFNPTFFYEYIPLCMVGISFIFSNMLFSYQTKSSNILFIIGIVTLFVILFINIWMPLYSF